MSKEPEVFKIKLTEDQKKEMEEYRKLFCSCDNQSEIPQYVEGHMGVHHGWICTNCNHFVQIG